MNVIFSLLKGKLKFMFFGLIFIIGVFGLIVGLAIMFFVNNITNRNRVENTQNMRMVVGNTVVEGFNRAGRLVVLDVDLSYSITIDNSWGNFAIFTNAQDITMYSTGTFSTNLYNLTANDIIWEYDGGITVSVPFPEIESIQIHPDETTFYTTAGLFRTGQINISPEEHNYLLAQAQHQMELNMLTNLMGEARLATQSAVENLFYTILSSSGLEDFNVRVLFQAG